MKMKVTVVVEVIVQVPEVVPRYVSITMTDTVVEVDVLQVTNLIKGIIITIVEAVAVVNHAGIVPKVPNNVINLVMSPVDVVKVVPRMFVILVLSRLDQVMNVIRIVIIVVEVPVVHLVITGVHLKSCVPLILVHQ